MTLKKKLKKAVRARSRKTGESYTTARRQLLAHRRKSALPEPPAPEPAQLDAAPAAAPPPPPATSLTKGAVSDGAVRQKTGFGLDHWFAVLDAFDAPAKGHTAAAAHLRQAHRVSSWYSQGITVAYERARGLRDLNQSCAGTFQVSVSKTVPATVAEVVEALRSADQRAAWLAGADPEIVQALEAAFSGARGAKPREVKTKGSDTAWLRFPVAGKTVELRITARPKGGASVVADNSTLPTPDLVEQRRAQWRKALEGLHRHLSR